MSVTLVSNIAKNGDDTQHKECGRETPALLRCYIQQGYPLLLHATHFAGISVAYVCSPRGFSAVEFTLLITWSIPYKNTHIRGKIIDNPKG